jgi:hypothetical protein
MEINECRRTIRRRLLVQYFYRFWDNTLFEKKIRMSHAISISTSPGKLQITKTWTRFAFIIEQNCLRIIQNGNDKIFLN